MSSLSEIVERRNEDMLAEREELLVAVERLRAFVGALRADGLDIDDPDTAPTWTGKIHAPDGALLFDLATARDELARLRAIESAARAALPSAEAMLAMAQQWAEGGGRHGPEQRECDECSEDIYALEAALADQPTPYSAICHHQDRPHCAGCPDDPTCEASGREPRGTT